MQQDNKPIFEVGKEYPRRGGGTSIVLKNDMPIGQPIIAVDTVNWVVTRHNADGAYINNANRSDHDLIPPPEVISDGWRNVFNDGRISAYQWDSINKCVANGSFPATIGQVHLRILKMHDGKIKVEQVEE